MSWQWWVLLGLDYVCLMLWAREPLAQPAPAAPDSGLGEQT